MSETSRTPAELAEAIRRIAARPGASELELQIEVEKLLHRFFTHLPVRSGFGQATKFGDI